MLLQVVETPRQKVRVHQVYKSLRLTTIPEEEEEEQKDSSFCCAGDDSSQACRVLINGERQQRGLVPLQSNCVLDEMARLHAESMADKQGLFHSVLTVPELRERLGTSRVGENIQRGHTVEVMHDDIMRDFSSETRKMYFSQHFQELGVGVAKSGDGTVYLCQLFRDMPSPNHRREKRVVRV